MAVRANRSPWWPYPRRCVTSYDLKRINALLYSRLLSKRGELPILDQLKDGLEQAAVVPPFNVPPQVVTMGSKVRVLDLATRRMETYALVFPAEARIEENRISILSPVGTALLGRHAGDRVSCVVPSGRREIKIVDVVYQPEAMGNYAV